MVLLHSYINDNKCETLSMYNIKKVNSDEKILKFGFWRN